MVLLSIFWLKSALFAQQASCDPRARSQHWCSSPSELAGLVEVWSNE